MDAPLEEWVPAATFDLQGWLLMDVTNDARFGK